MPLDLVRGFPLKCAATATAGAPELPQFVTRQPQKKYSRSFARTNPVICAPLGEAGSAFANWPWCLKFGFDEITIPEVKHYCASVEATDLQALCNHICLCRLLFGNYFLSCLNVCRWCGGHRKHHHGFQRMLTQVHSFFLKAHHSQTQGHKVFFTRWCLYTPSFFVSESCHVFLGVRFPRNDLL